MGTNRVIKTDNEIDVEGSNINLKATTDITGDCNISSNLTASGTVQGFTFPSDGTNGQILSTNGSGALSFIDAATGGGGVDTITSATEAANYTGTNRIIHITANEAVTFSTDLRNKIIIMEEEHDLKFQDCKVINSIIQHYDHIIFENTANASILANTVSFVQNCKIQAFGKVEFLDNRNAAGERHTISFCDIRCSNFKTNNVNTNAVIVNKSNISCSNMIGSGSATYHFDIDSSHISTDTMNGNYDFANSVAHVARGSNSGNLKIKTNGTDKFNSVYNHSFKVMGNIVTPQRTMANIIAANTGAFTSNNARTENMSFSTTKSSSNYANFFTISSSSGNTNDKINFTHKGKYKINLFVGGQYAAATYAVSGTTIFGVTTGSSLPRFSLRFDDNGSVNSVSFARLSPHSSGITTGAMSGSFVITDPTNQHIFVEHEDIHLSFFMMEIELIELD